MRLDDLKFDNDEDRRHYLSELARLKRIREIEKDKMVNNKINITKSNKYSTDLNILKPKKANSHSELKENSLNRHIKKRNSTIIKTSSNNKSFNKENLESDTLIKNKTSKIKKNKISNTKKRINSKRNQKKKLKKGIILLQLLALAFIAFGIYIGILYLSAKETGTYTVAIFGVDSRDGNLKKGALADVNMIAHINKETGEIKLVSLYRDTYSEIDGKGTYHKLNEAYFKGGPAEALTTIERNFDIKVDDYATVNWKAVIEAINILGGVDVEITEPEFKYINSFITETVNSTGIGSVQLKSPGMQHLDGVQAVAYARLRLMDTDYKRTERQRKVVSLAFDKAKNADFATLNSVLLTVLPQISTSIGINDLMPFAKGIDKYHLGATTGFPFEKDNKVIKKRDYVIPISLENNVISLHKFLFGEDIRYTPSNSVKNISKHIIEVTGIGKNKNSNNIEIKYDEVTNKSKKETLNLESKSESAEIITSENGFEIEESENKEDILSSNNNETIINNIESIINDIPENDNDEIKNNISKSPIKENADDVGNGPAYDVNN